MYPPDGVFNECCRFVYTPDLLLDSELLEFTRIFNDCHQDEYKSNSKLITQLGMLKRISSDISLSSYTYIFLLRGDTVVEMNVMKVIQKLVVNNILIFLQWGIERGLNERFVAGPVEYILPLINLIDYAKLQVRKYGCLNGEMLAWFVVRKLKIPFVMLDIKVSRVRFDNSIKIERFKFPWRYPRDAVFF